MLTALEGGKTSITFLLIVSSLKCGGHVFLLFLLHVKAPPVPFIIYENCKVHILTKYLWELRNVFHRLSLTNVSEAKVQNGVL